MKFFTAKASLLLHSSSTVNGDVYILEVEDGGVLGELGGMPQEQERVARTSLIDEGGVAFLTVGWQQL